VPGPIETKQAAVGFDVRGHEVAWQRWRFHARLDPRAGLVLSTVAYDDAGALRSVLYAANVAELFVPYMDPDPLWYFRSYLDMGEYGLGKLTSTLVEAVDCPARAVYLGDVLADDQGRPVPRDRVICLFERETGDVAWRHWDLVTGTNESRTGRELVVRSVATIGNYDYVFDWIFRQDGTIRVSVGATGIAEAKVVKPRHAGEEGGAEAMAYGRFVDDHTVAVNHDHFLSFRLDFDVDGPTNSLSIDEIRTVKAKRGPRKSLWTVTSRIAEREVDGKLHRSMERPALWRVVNPSASRVGGSPTSFEIHSGHDAMAMLAKDDFPQRRAGFTDHTLWVTPYDPKERFAAGDYPNQSPGGEGLPKWTKANRPIEATDIVLWYTLGFHHVVRAEDWPVMPTSTHGFEIRPFDFFRRNPAIDLP
jgi:primary-amine oxidase